MKNLKLLLVTIIALILVCPSNAQYYDYNGMPAPPRNSETIKEYKYYYGLRLGLNLSHINSDDNRLSGNIVMPGLNFGIIGGLQLSPVAPIYIETGLFYIENGGKGYYEGEKFTFDLNYLKLPISIKYRINISGSDFYIDPFLGGYFALGIAGKMKLYDSRTLGNSFSRDNFRRFDGGLKFGCGAEYSLAYLEIGYDLGLANICHDYFDTSHNGCFYINAGVNF